MKTFIATLIAAFTVSAAYAAGPDFSTADTNGDGVLTMEEAKAAMPEVEEAKLVAADVNGDGTLDANEYAALTAG